MVNTLPAWQLQNACERHKAMKSESIAALGLTYTINSSLMDRLFEFTVGMPPYLYLRTLRHLLLLAHIHVASHMSLPLVRSQKDISLDPFIIYDRTKTLYYGCAYLQD